MHISKQLIKGTVSVISSDPPWNRVLCPIHNGTLDTFDGLSSREIFMFKRISKTVCSSKTLLYAVVQS